MAGHTEKEAAELWCPHARLVHVFGGKAAPIAGNSVMHADTGRVDVVRCIGSRCSQWRWFDAFDQTIRSTIQPPGNGWEDCGKAALQSDETIRVWTRIIPDDERRGFCGLAGRP